MKTSDLPEHVLLKDHVEYAYLHYAVATVKDRSLPSVEDGMKPVQRRILFSMRELGLAATTKPAKAARTVGDVIGKYHPHGDVSVYDAMVRMAQEFTLRYPLVDGQGNFGSRDGDNAAAMRYTEARLTAFAEHVLLSETSRATVRWAANYDGSLDEPALLAARLPVLLLNGASGIAVGMATDIPPHNLCEVSAAAIACLKTPGLGTAELLAHLRGPDFPDGGRLIAAPEALAQVYDTGRGSLRMEAVCTREDLARGQWRLVFNGLPYGVSVSKIMGELKNLSEPQPKGDKKKVSPEQLALRDQALALIDSARDESSRDQPVRLVIEPKTAKIEQDVLVAFLYAHTSLAASVTVNLTLVGLDGRPTQKSLPAILYEWTEFRTHTVRKRTEHQLSEVQARLHILAGRLLILLDIDEVIRIIRNSDEPKPALIKRFKLSDVQADDILNIRLRQLARLEQLALEKEQATLKKEEGRLAKLLAHRTALVAQVIAEIEADTQRFGDARRTDIVAKATVTAPAEYALPAEPVTVALSKAGWLKLRTGHGHTAEAIAFKNGDTVAWSVETQSTSTVALFDTQGRVYNVPVARIPGGRSDGAPATSLAERAPSAEWAGLMTIDEAARYFIAATGGYGFSFRGSALVTRMRAGKVLLTVKEGEKALCPIVLPDEVRGLLCVSSSGKGLAFELGEFQDMDKGRGLKLMRLGAKDHLTQVAAIVDTGAVLTGGTVTPAAVNKVVGTRAGAGQKLAIAKASKAKQET